MSKKNIFLLRSALFILIIIIVVSSAYYYFHSKIIDFYSAEKNDMFLSTMQEEYITTFQDDSSVILGSFLQNDDLYAEKSLFIKSYSKNGKLNNIGSIDLPYGYILTDTFEKKDCMYVLYSDQNKTSGDAIIYKISSEGVLLDQIYIEYNEYSGRSKDFFLLSDSEVIKYAVMVDNYIYIFSQDGSSFLNLNITPDVKIYDMAFFKEQILLAGSIKTDSGFNSYHMSYDFNGKLLYATNTMINMPSHASKIIVNNSGDTNSYFITGYYFDVEDYRSYNSSFSKDQINDLSIKCLKKASNKAVLLSSSYATEPWPSMYIMKIDKNGELISSISPVIASPTMGLSGIHYVNNDGVKTTDKKPYPIITITSNVAKNLKSKSYDVAIYNIYSDLSYDYSSDIIVNSDIKTEHIINSDGSINVYTGLNSKNNKKMHHFDSVIEFAKNQRNILFYYRMIEYIEICLTKLPLVSVMLILMITVRYSIYDYKEKKRIVKI